MKKFSHNLASSEEGFAGRYSLGFTLIEVLAALTVLTVIFIFLAQLTSFFETQSKLKISNIRMEKVVAQAKRYYRSYKKIPETGSQFQIPIGRLGFDLEQKDRLDGWGQFMRYYAYRNAEDILIDDLQTLDSDIGIPEGGLPLALVVLDAGTQSLIRGVESRGKRVAGLFVSSGPNTLFEYSVHEGQDLSIFIPDEHSDDIFMPIILTEEANRVALNELKALNNKVKAFEDRYLGIDNNQNGHFDERGCRPVPREHKPPDFSWGGQCVPREDCPYVPSYSDQYFLPPGPVPGQDPGDFFDINCGMGTLDYMKANYCDLSEYNPTVNDYCASGYGIPPTPDIDCVPICEYGRPCCSDTDIDPLPPTYARFPIPDPIDRFNPEPACNWGLVDSEQPNSDQARAFLFCVFNLSPENIVDPWLKGYEWGCGGSDCQQTYPPDDPHYHRFFSCGPDGRPADPGVPEDPNDDIIF